MARRAGRNDSRGDRETVMSKELKCAHCGNPINPMSSHFADVPGEGDLCAICHPAWMRETDGGKRRNQDVVSVPPGQSPIAKEFKP